MARASKQLEGTKALMGALVRMKPKPHEEIKAPKRGFKKKLVQKGKK